MTEQQITIAARLYEMRDTARQLLGDRYKQQMAELGRLLKMTAELNKKSVLTVATEASKRDGARPMDVIFIMAAAVEIMEQSTDQNADVRA